MAHGKTGRGICIICGKLAAGIPAKPDTIILAARRLRQLLRRKPVHTVVDKAHLAEARQKRAKFDSMRKIHRIGAALFFLLLSGGMAIQSGFTAMTFISAALGSVFIYLLAYVGYFPEFK